LKKFQFSLPREQHRRHSTGRHKTAAGKEESRTRYMNRHSRQEQNKAQQTEAVRQDRRGRQAAESRQRGTAETGRDIETAVGNRDTSAGRVVTRQAQGVA
jgi:hypothetical protein